MSLGKIKMKGGFFGKKFSFYEYARHTLASAAASNVQSTMNELASNTIMGHNIYLKTKNFYIQLLAAYSASYFYYPIFAQIVPIQLLEEGLKEIIRGRDVGIKAWTFDNHPIEDELVEKYKITFKRYYNGLMKDCNDMTDNSVSAGVFNPDINEFTKLFVEDSIYLMENESNTSINEIERMYLSNMIANIPISVFQALSQTSMEYIN
jgi:hypothetical protein